MSDPTTVGSIPVSPTIIPCQTVHDPTHGDVLVVSEKYRTEKLPRTVAPCEHVPRTYEARNLADFVSYIKTQPDANPTKGVIFYFTDSVRFYFDEKNRKEIVFFRFQPSMELLAFLDKHGERVFTQKSLAKALELYPDVVAEAPELLPRISMLNLDTAIQVESSVDPRNISFMYKEKTGNQTANIPRYLHLCLPYFEGGSHMSEIEVELELRIPKAEGEKPMFILTDYRTERNLKDAARAEIATLRQSLPEWRIFEFV